MLTAACNSSRYFIVRHAEKAVLSRDSAGMMANNPPLSEAGKVRSFVLRDELAHKKIRHIYSTNTLRTTSTAEPLSNAKSLPMKFYSNVDTLVNLVKSIKGQVLIVGHSNTVDDIVNKLCGQVKIATDVKDGEYDNLFIVKIKGKKAVFQKHKYGYPSNP